MKHSEFKLKYRNINIVKEDFRDFNELLRVCDDREPNRDWEKFEYSEPCRTNNNSSWAGASYETAVDLLTHGWKEKITEIKSKLDKSVKAENTKMVRTQKLGVTGYSPCVPNAIVGVPKSMFYSNKVPKKSKIIEILYDITFASDVEVEDCINKGIELLSKIYSLEMNGFRVKLSAVGTYLKDYEDEGYIMAVAIKNENQPIDLSRIAFPLAHPAMLRKISFDWYERLPNAKYITGYGRPMHYLVDSLKNEITDAVCAKNTYFIDYYSDLDEVFKSVK